MDILSGRGDSVLFARYTGGILSKSTKRVGGILSRGDFAKSKLSKFRCGVTPTCRLRGLHLQLCNFCNVIENEMHSSLNCRIYGIDFFQKASDLSHHFDSMSDKFIFLSSNNDILRLCAETCA